MEIEPLFLTQWERDDYERKKRGERPLGPLGGGLTLTMTDMLEIVKPHNDKLIAEGRLAEAERQIERLYGQIFDLKSALGGLSALMLYDIEAGTITPTKIRTELLGKARELSAQ